VTAPETPDELRARLSELHDAIIEYLAEFDYPTTTSAWERLRAAGAAAAIVLRMPGRSGDRETL
jgi:hypothetical protein